MSTLITPPSSPELEITPEFESRVFAAHQDAQFCVRALSVPGILRMGDEALAAHQLRANVYIDDMGFLPESAKSEDGGEYDADDERSVLFGIMERAEDVGSVIMRGTSRLIIKRSEDDLLPVERMFPEAFGDSPAPVNSTEASRFIARHPNKLTQHAVSLSSIRAMAYYSIKNGLEPVYAVIEEPLARLFDQIDLPYDVIGASKQLGEYEGTNNMAVRMVPEIVVGSVKSQEIRSDIMELFFSPAMAKNMGIGYFNALLTEGLE